jgi:hypothetical protein
VDNGLENGLSASLIVSELHAPANPASNPVAIKRDEDKTALDFTR